MTEYRYIFGIYLPGPTKIASHHDSDDEEPDSPKRRRYYILSTDKNRRHLVNEDSIEEAWSMPDTEGDIISNEVNILKVEGAIEISNHDETISFRARKDINADSEQQDETEQLIKDSKDHQESTAPSIYLDLSLPENVFLLFTYFASGFALTFTQTPVLYYLIHDLDASSAQIGIYATIRVLPFSFSAVFGWLSDSVPILGYRRKPYIFIGWTLYLFANLILALLQTPSIVTVIVYVFLMLCALIMTEVCTDTMIVERSKFESPDAVGQLQTQVHASRALGKFVGSVLGALVYNSDSWNWGLYIWQIFLLNGIMPIMFIASSFVPLVEIASMQTNMSLSARLESVWSTLQQRAVLRPMAFIYLFNFMQVANSAWNNYLIESLHFSGFEIGILAMVGTFMSFIGLVIYREYLFVLGWRSVYILCTVSKLLFGILQLALIEQINIKIGIPNLIFALGDNVLSDFFKSFRNMPSYFMFAAMCPDGSEGFVYALLTTIGSLAHAIAENMSSWCTRIWNVSNTTLEAGHYSGLIKLSILTTILQIAPISLVYLLPNSKEDLKRRQDQKITSEIGGWILIFVTVASFIFTIGFDIFLAWRK